MVEPVAEVVRREIGLKEPQAPVVDMHVRADEADAAVSDDLDLRADKRDADLKPRKDRIVMEGPAIARKQLSPTISIFLFTHFRKPPCPAGNQTEKSD